MKRFKKILANILDIDESQITEETSSDNAETWDSFNGLMLVSELEKEFNVTFTMDEVRLIKSVRDIIEILKRYNVNLK